MTSAAGVTITWLGQSGFLLEADGTGLLVDALISPHPDRQLSHDGYGQRRCRTHSSVFLVPSELNPFRICAEPCSTVRDEQIIRVRPVHATFCQQIILQTGTTVVAPRTALRTLHHRAKFPGTPRKHPKPPICRSR